ncbi:MAG: glutamine--fructose-6-phosphate transaminase (isomerizing) [Acidimicrobiia bacterium]|nr:glutamine--fructose-6-phosphate transaminase (isomerizing) [Acidimicrobiia bacterium]
MCGIVAYTGDGRAVPYLLDGLARLEYRGYDSAGVAVHSGAGIDVVRRTGKLAALESAAELDALGGTTGIGHTRWATHGKPCDANAHPHVDAARRIALVHNGIIENHHELRAELEAGGVEFGSDTDTEVVAQLIGHLMARDPDLRLADAVRTAAKRLDGAFALAVIAVDDPDLVVGARRAAPLVAGTSGAAGLLASDIPAILAETRDVVVLDDDQVVEVRGPDLVVTDIDGEVVEARRTHITWDLEAAEKGGYETFMLKEIHEQPRVLADTIGGRLDTDTGQLVLDELRTDEHGLKTVDKVFVVACGTSYHSGLVAKYAIEHWARIPVEIDVASEFRYRDPVLDAQTLVIGVSQSGETADTIAACRYAQELKAKVVAVTNVVDSTMAREADAVIYTHAGPEVSVAASKTFTCQIAALDLLALWLAQVRGTLYSSEVATLVDQMHRLPDQVAAVLADLTEVEAEAAVWKDAADAFYLGRGPAFPTALEGALKMKEISYLHAEAYPSGELKHGPLALIDDDVPVVSVVTASKVHAKTLSNVAEVAARGGRIVLVANPGTDFGGIEPDRVFEVPETHELFAPVVDSVVLQVLAYYVATARGCNVDKPRNLAKTVTVE